MAVQTIKDLAVYQKAYDLAMRVLKFNATHLELTDLNLKTAVGLYRG